MFSLKDKVALVTGASQGIGRATALALAEAGAKGAVAARPADKLASVVWAVEAEGGGGGEVVVWGGRGERRGGGGVFWCCVVVGRRTKKRGGFSAGAREIRQA